MLDARPNENKFAVAYRFTLARANEELVTIQVVFRAFLQIYKAFILFLIMVVLKLENSSCLINRSIKK